MNLNLFDDDTFGSYGGTSEGQEASILYTVDMGKAENAAKFQANPCCYFILFFFTPPGFVLCRRYQFSGPSLIN